MIGGSEPRGGRKPCLNLNVFQRISKHCPLRFKYRASFIKKMVLFPRNESQPVFTASVFPVHMRIHPDTDPAQCRTGSHPAHIKQNRSTGGGEAVWLECTCVHPISVHAQTSILSGAEHRKKNPETAAEFENLSCAQYVTCEFFNSHQCGRPCRHVFACVPGTHANGGGIYPGHYTYPLD